MEHNCGIAGFMKFRDCNIRYDNLEGMFEALELRGTDATGFAYPRKGESVIVKMPCEATKALKSRHFKYHLREAAKAQWGLLHTRAATNGSARSNRNNHPIYSKDGLIIHNGIVYTEGVIKGKQGKTDTEEILLSLDRHGFKGIQEVSGWMAIAYQKFSEANTFYLYRHNAPIQIWRTDDFLTFASTEFILEYAFILQDVKTVSLPADTFLKVSPKGVKEVGKFEPASMYADSKFWNRYDYISYPVYNTATDAPIKEEDLAAMDTYLPVRYRMSQIAGQIDNREPVKLLDDGAAYRKSRKYRPQWPSRWLRKWRQREIGVADEIGEY